MIIRYGTRTIAASLLALCPIAANEAAAQTRPSDPQDTPHASDQSEQDKIAAPETEAAILDVIIVTANKRPESIMEVAGAVSALRGEDLLKSGITSISDFAALTPGLQFNASFGTGSPVIRGINTGADFGQSVGITIDGAPVGPSSSFQTGGASSLDLDPTDIDRVEVLKGPQGTIYGANTLAGLLSYTLREPNLSTHEGVFRASAGNTQGGGSSRSMRAAISVPIINDVLAVRISGFDDRRGGFIDNDLTSTTDQNEWRSRGVQGSVKFRPNDRLTMQGTGIFQKQDQFAQDQLIYGADRRPRDGDLLNNEYLIASTDRKTRFAVAKIDYDLDFASLTSVSAWQHLNVNYSAPQATGTLNSIFVNVLPALGGVTIPEPGLLSNDTLNDFKKFSQELRLTSTSDGPLNWIVGAYYTNENSEQQQSVNARTTTSDLISAISPTLRVALPTELTEYSVFANVTYAFSPRFDVTGGIRSGRIKQTNRTLLSGTNLPAYQLLFVLSGLGSGPPADTGPQDGSETVQTYLATARYHFSEDSMVFARFATGFRPGGPNFPIPGFSPVYDADETYNYEVGLKTSFWNRRGSLDITAYNMQWKNFLAFASAGGLSGFENAGDARVYGAEAALAVRPFEGFNISGTLAYSDSKITSISAESLVAGVGDQLPYNPEWSGSLSAEYRAPINPTWNAVASGSARFVGSRNSSPESSVAFPNYNLPAYSLFDIQAGVERDEVNIDLFVRNLTNERAQLAAYTQLGPNQITINQPRTIGLAVTYRY